MYCINPACPSPKSSARARFCQNCGAELQKPYIFRDRYRVLEILGQGGFGRTYKAQDLEFEKRFYVIKKLIAPETLEQCAQLQPQVRQEMLKKAIECFKREIQQLASLNHPQIPHFYEHFEINGSPYLVQEFIDGDNLLIECQKNGSFSEAQVKELLESLLPVLEYLHSYRVLHRDIKPENIMRRRHISGSSQFVLIDFGGAKEKAQSSFGLAGTAFYSPGYASPEHTTGQHQQTSDIYSLGATCVRLLTGSFPWESEENQIFLNGENRWLWQQVLAAQNRSVSDDLAYIFDKMLRWSPAERYQSAAEVLEALHRLPSAQVGTVQSSQNPAVNSAKTSFSQAKTFAFSPASPSGNSGASNSFENSVSNPPPAKNNTLLLIFGCLGLAIGIPILGLTTAAILIGTAYDESQPSTHNNRGDNYYNQNQYDKALVEYNRAIELDPNNAAVYHSRGNVYYQQGEYDKAIAEYTRAIDMNSNYNDAYTNRGNAYSKREEYDRAIADFNRALEIDPNNTYAYNCRGIFYHNRKEYYRAIADYTRALEIDSRYAGAYYNLGLVYSKLKKYDEAITQYNYSLEIDPNDSYTYNNRGFAYYKQKKYDKAMTDYNRALKESDVLGTPASSHTLAYENRGDLYNEQKKYGKAISDYNRAIELSPDYGGGYYSRGLSYKAAGNLPKAREDLQKAVLLYCGTQEDECKDATAELTKL